MDKIREQDEKLKWAEQCMLKAMDSKMAIDFNLNND